MSEGPTLEGPHFRCFHAGPLAELDRYAFPHPLVQDSISGKLFLKALLGLEGIEISLNRLAPGQAVPFLHRHRRNEEVYLFLGGRGQLLVDGEVLEVGEGSVVRVSPAAARAWRNHGDTPLHYLVIQYPEDARVEGGIADGEPVRGRPRWPDAEP